MLQFCFFIQISIVHIIPYYSLLLPSYYSFLWSSVLKFLLVFFFHSINTETIFLFDLYSDTSYSWSKKVSSRWLFRYLEFAGLVTMTPCDCSEVGAELTGRKTWQTDRSGESFISFCLFIYSLFIFEKLQRKSCILLKLLTKTLITVIYLLKIT